MAAAGTRKTIRLAGRKFDVPSHHIIPIDEYITPEMKSYRPYLEIRSKLSERKLQPLSFVIEDGTSFYAFSTKGTVAWIYPRNELLVEWSSTDVERTYLSRLPVTTLQEMCREKLILVPRIPAIETKEDFIRIITNTDERRKIRRTFPYAFNRTKFSHSESLRPNEMELMRHFFDCMRRYYRVPLPYELDSMSNIIDCITTLVYLGLAVYTEEKTFAIYDVILDINEALESNKEVPVDYTRRASLQFDLGDRIRIYSPVTFGQLRDALVPVKEYKDVYTRWAAIADKQAVVDLMAQVVMDKVEKRDRGFNPLKTIRSLLSLDVTHSLEGDLKRILVDSKHPFLTSRLSQNKKILETFTATARFIKEVGPNTTLTLDKGRDIMFPAILLEKDEPRRPILWSEFINLVLCFIVLLPKPIPENWAELYVQSFVEGYDLKVDRFPMCAVPPIYGRPARPDTQEYTSCHLGMEYHMLIALYDVLFTGHEPKQLDDTSAVKAVEQQDHRAFRLPIVMKIVQDYLQEFIRENDSKEEFTEAQKEDFKQKCTIKILEKDITKDGYDWRPLINEVIDGALLGKRIRRKKIKSKRSKTKIKTQINTNRKNKK